MVKPRRDQVTAVLSKGLNSLLSALGVGLLAGPTAATLLCSNVRLGLGGPILLGSIMADNAGHDVPPGGAGGKGDGGKGSEGKGDGGKGKGSQENGGPPAGVASGISQLPGGAAGWSPNWQMWEAQCDMAATSPFAKHEVGNNGVMSWGAELEFPGVLIDSEDGIEGDGTKAVGK